MAFKRLFANFRDPNLNEWLAELQRRIAAATTAATETILGANFLWVGSDGDNATAVKGSIVNKWRTVNAALAAADPSLFEVVVVVDGADAEDVVVPSAKGGLLVVLEPGAAQVNTLSFAPAGDTQPLIVIGLSVAGLTDIDGSAIPNAFENADCDFFDCLLNGVTVQRCSTARFIGCKNDGPVTIADTTDTWIKCELNNYSRAVNYSGPQPTPPTTPAVMRFTETSNVVLSDQAVLELENCTIGDVSINAIDDPSQRTAALLASNTRCGAISVAANLNNGAGPHQLVDMEASHVTQGVTADAAAGTVRGLLTFRACSLAGLTVQAGGRIDMDLSASNYDPAALASGGIAPNEGRINRDVHRIPGSLAGNPPFVVAITPPFIDNQYTVTREENVGPDTDVVVSAKNYNNFTAAGFAPGSAGTPNSFGADWVLLRR